MFFLKRPYIFIISICFFFYSCGSKEEKSMPIRNIEEFNLAVKNASPGAVLVLANGIWKDTELLFEGKGTEEEPITLTVETKGKVIFTGASNLRIAGEYLLVEGLVFKHGFTPTGSVISFRKDEDNLANNSRLTECVIDNFSNPERQESDYWIELYGKNNRVDHNHIAGKRNLGVTMAVRLNTIGSQQNYHRIDHNYFGPRPNLGSNGGETLRIGTSHFSLTNSNTLVESNYFDRCNGEHEIISNKSGQNTYKNNVFYECTGTLTMRHGSETMVDGNVFIGNNKPSTGGIRIINQRQTVVNNYAIGLTGYRFRGAFVMMNGVPNSPINRYHQVDSAVVKNNVFINCDHIQLCAGADAERSAVPINSVMSDNIFVHEKRSDIFTIYDDISGIDFENNLISPNIQTDINRGFKKADFSLVKNDLGLLLPQSEELRRPLSISNEIATKENCGVTWYSKHDSEIAFKSGKIIAVAPGLNTLYEAVNSAAAGDVLVLEAGSPYKVSKIIKVGFPISLKAKSKEKPLVLPERNSLFEIQNGGSLCLEGIAFDGKNAPDYSGNSVIRTSKSSMNKNYKLFIDDCDFGNFDVNHSYDFFQVFKNTFADTISIQNSTFRNITGHVLALDKETDDTGIYNAEYVILKNNLFKDIQGSVLNLYRGGTDESTFGPFLELENCVFDQVGFGKRNKAKSAMSLYGVQEITIQNNIFKNSNKLYAYLVVGEPIVNILNNNLFESEDFILRGDQKYNMANIWKLNPNFIEGTFKLSANSPLKNKGTDGFDLGIISNK